MTFFVTKSIDKISYDIYNVIMKGGEHMKIGDFVKSKREAKGLTQQQLADLIGCTRSVITMIETNTTYKPSVPTAKQIGHILNFEWTKFF